MKMPHNAFLDKEKLSKASIHVAWYLLYLLLLKLTPQYLENRAQQGLLILIGCVLLGHVALLLFRKTTKQDWQISFFLVVGAIFIYLAKTFR